MKEIVRQIHNSSHIALRLLLSDGSRASAASEVEFSLNVPYADGTFTSATPRRDCTHQHLLLILIVLNYLVVYLHCSQPNLQHHTLD